MDYVEVSFRLQPVDPARDILTAYLGEEGYDMFQEDKDGFKAYIKADQFDQASLDGVIQNVPFAKVEYVHKTIADQNWNATWESQFEPIDVDGLCYIRAPFHEAVSSIPLEIIIQPQMSFGTGHHATTYQMVKAMLDLDLTDKVVLDMGAGTAILAILAEKRAAKSIDAIDIEEWAYHNAQENAQLNGCQRIVAKLGDAELVPKEAAYDVILANIHKNILIHDMEAYVRAMNTNAFILFSGFFPTDDVLLTEKADSLGLTLHQSNQHDGWSQLTFQKKA